MSYKILLYYVIIIVFLLGGDGPSELLFFVPALLLSILTLVFLPYSSVSLLYLVFALLMRECTSYPFPLSILKGACLFRETR